uniref:Chromosome X open reading frame 65 n=1 Tax=Oncorhynchus tshawytscha TaxID=74940 RepID=A0AAZ3RJ87_ONCTS
MSGFDYRKTISSKSCTLALLLISHLYVTLHIQPVLSLSLRTDRFVLNVCVCVCARVSELVDLCDDRGALKLLFLSQQPQECASRLLPPRCSLTFCIVNRNPKDGAYISITPLVANPDPAFLETLQTQTDSLERARLRQLRSQEDRRATEAPSQTQPTQTAKGRGRAVHMDTPDDEPSNRRTGGRRSRN